MRETLAWAQNHPKQMGRVQSELAELKESERGETEQLELIDIGFAATEINDSFDENQATEGL